MKTFLVKDSDEFKLRVKVSDCLVPVELRSLEFTGEQYDTDGQLINASTYQFFLQTADIQALCDGLTAC